jgi:hypothetical protein
MKLTKNFYFTVLLFKVSARLSNNAVCKIGLIQIYSLGYEQRNIKGRNGTNI